LAADVLAGGKVGYLLRRSANQEYLPSRLEAIRWLVEIGLKGEEETAMPGVTRFLEVDAFGRQTGRQLLLKPGAVMPHPLERSEWSADPAFSPADELLRSSGFKRLLESVLKNGFEIVTKK
jgi:hypothetical protein